MVVSGKGKSASVHAKGGKGLGKQWAKRHRKKQYSSTKICNPQIKRLARRGGVKRLSATCYPVIQRAIQDFVQQTICYSSTMA